MSSFDRRRFTSSALVASALLSLRCGSSESPGADPFGVGPNAAASDGGPSADGGSVDAPEPILPPGDPGPADVQLEARTDQNVHAISPYVYGINAIDKAGATHATLVRMGGNRLTAFNWENNASNAGSDWQFQNDNLMCNVVGGCAPNDLAPGAVLKKFVGTAASAGAAAMVTVPIVDYVAADQNGGGDVRNSGANYLQTRFKQNKPVKGSAFVNPPNTGDAFVYEDEMVSWLVAAEPNAKILFELDNEPDLWSGTHAEVHPDKVTYAELKTRTIDYAKAIKAVAPNADVWGPASYGWQGFITLQYASDASANGDFLDYYLDQMKAAEQAEGKRLLDGLDLHWYPEAQGGGVRITGTETGDDVVTAREQAPRSLWDASYTEESWITQHSTKGPIHLVPRMLGKIAAHYPGTKLGFTEWNYGGGEHISGAIAAADVLGIFGRDGVAVANYWPLHGSESFAYAAFKAFRAFDTGKAFGDTSVQASTTDSVRSSVYASVDAGQRNRMVLVVINKAKTDTTTALRVYHSRVLTHANVYTLTSAGPTLAAGAKLDAVATNAFRYTMPAQSVSVLELVP